jgi:hypothetical protein
MTKSDTSVSSSPAPGADAVDRSGRERGEVLEDLGGLLILAHLPVGVRASRC